MLHAALITTLTLLGPTGPTPEGDGWRTILDASSASLDGWTHVGPGSFEHSDGTFKTVGGMGLLYYDKEALGDCTIRVVYRAESESANSGVYVRIAEKPDDPWYAVHHGYEVQICDAADPFHRTGAVYSLSKSTGSPAKPGEWNTLEITLDGEIVKVAVNGEVVNSFDPREPVPPRTKDYEPERGPRPTTGYIGLQNHGGNDVVYFKEVSVKPLAERTSE